jgi:phosphoglycolate phosphatase
MIPHIIFDLDGTLVDSASTCIAILTDMVAERGSDHVIDQGDARRYMSHGGARMVEALLGPAGVDPQSDLADFRMRYRATETSAETLYPGVREGLEALAAAGFTLSICSNKPQVLCDKVLDDTAISSLFEVVVGGHSNLRPKPAPDLLDAVLDQLKVTVDQCLFVGDSQLDHMIAADKSMPFHFVTYGYAEDHWRPADVAIFDCFPSLTKAVLGRGALDTKKVRRDGNRLRAA